MLIKCLRSDMDIGLVVLSTVCGLQVVLLTVCGLQLFIFSERISSSSSSFLLAFGESLQETIFLVGTIAFFSI